MALRFAPFLLLVLKVAVREGCFDYSSHTLKYLHIAISDPSQELPHYIALGYVNDQLFSYYNSSSRKMQPRVSWAEKMEKENPQFWDNQTQIFHDVEEELRINPELGSCLHNETEVYQDYEEMNTQGPLLEEDYSYISQKMMAFEKGLHIRQRIDRCALMGDGSKRMLSQTAYDGETQFSWDLPADEESECIAWLEKYLSYRKDTLLRTEPGVVTVSSRMEAEDGMETHVCRVHGFYPKEIYASWRRDGKIWLQDTLHGSVAPNADGTYYYWLSIRIDPKERDRYQCYVKYNSLQAPVVLPLTESNLGLIIGCVMAGLIVVIAIAGISVFLRSHRSGRVQVDHPEQGERKEDGISFPLN